MAKHYYAAEHHYGIEFCNDYRWLFRFTSREQRDKYVEDANWEEVSRGGCYQTEAITRAEARRHFPNAFRTVDDCGYTHDVSDARDWLKDTDSCEYWSANNIYCD